MLKQKDLGKNRLFEDAFSISLVMWNV